MMTDTQTNGVAILDLKEETEKATEISLDLLRHSIRHEGKYGDTLETKPVQIWNLVDEVTENLDKAGIIFQPGKVFIQKRHSAAMLNDSDRDAGFNKLYAPINRWKFEKVITDLSIPNIGGEGHNAHVALTLNEKGIVVAYGMNIHVCTNFNVMGGAILRTYTHGNQKGTPWQAVRSIISNWSTNLEQVYNIQRELMQEFMNKEVRDERTIQKIIGVLYTNAIKNAYFKKDVGLVTPFDTGELSMFVQTMINQRKEEEKIGNVWDLYNWGTSIMKPNSMDIGEIANNSSIFSSFLCDQFGIPEPNVILAELV